MSGAGESTARALLCCCCGAGAMVTASGGACSRAAASASPAAASERSSFDAIWDEWEAEAARAAPAPPAAQRGGMSAAALALLPSPGRRAARFSTPARGASAQAAPGEIVELVRSQTERFFEHLRSEATALRAENAQLREAAAAAAATKEALQRAPVPRSHARRLTASAAVAEETMHPRSDNGGDVEAGTPRWHDPCAGPWYDGAPLATALPPARVIRSAAASSQGDIVSHSAAFTAHIAGIGRRSPRPAAAGDDADGAERGSAPGSARSDASSDLDHADAAAAGGDASDGGDSARSGGAARGAAMRVCRAAAASCGASMEALSALLHLRSGGDDVIGGEDYDDGDGYDRGVVTMAAPPQPQPRAWAQASPVQRQREASPCAAYDDVAGESCASLASLRALRIGAVAAAEAACADAEQALRRGKPPPPRAPSAPGAAAAAEAAAEAVREASDTFAARADANAAVDHQDDASSDATSSTASGVRRGALPRPAAWPFAARGIEAASDAVMHHPSSSAPAADVAGGLAFPRDYWDDVAAARALRAMPSAAAGADGADGAADSDSDEAADAAPLSFAAALAAAAAAQSDATAAASAALARAAALRASSEALCAAADDAAGGPASAASAKAVAQPVEARDADALREAAGAVPSSSS